MSDSTHGFATYGGPGLYKSSDGGHTWQTQSMPSDVGQVQFFDPSHGVASAMN